MNALQEIQKEKIVEAFHNETGLPYEMLEMIYQACSKIPDHKLKLIRKNKYKYKYPIKKRQVFQDGQIIKGVEIKDNEDNVNKVYIEELKSDENITDNDINEINEIVSNIKLIEE